MFVNWGVLVGEGTDNVKNFTSSDQIFDLGRRLWGGAWIIILIAAVNSGARSLHRDPERDDARPLRHGPGAGAAAPSLERCIPRWKTPWNAIWLLTGVTLAIGLGLGSWLGPVKTFGMIGIMQTLGLIIVYCMGNIGAMLFYGREKRDRVQRLAARSSSRSLTTVALAWVFWKNVETLHPFSPKNAFDYSPLIVIIWTVVGLAILVYASRTGKEAWLLRAGESVQLRAETAAEAAHRPAL